ncbi:glycosyltransferase family 20-domain-containing protein [Radiomyces spectabilis]|uniref:glycosyltransferase family 20-domain-containing protein n=1 Tax=Radiomyces spectabilis TaxID=64574 RepID=UPI00221E4834|nr:glycosyltransferase family 20-domain-containing protein [Radiomyces spectabilis]KAI8391219.1 glycosyltransferase family 20-domain-containing protein [Radiomyces spectabilis]
MILPSSESLTAEKVANYLPLSGHLPEIPGRIINVTHQIPYNILRTQDTASAIRKDDPAAAAPVSRLARHHYRSRTLRAKFHAADWTVVERRGHQALYAGLQSLNKNWETLHIGWTGPIRIKGSKKQVAPEQVALEDKKKLQELLWNKAHVVPIFLDKTSHGHYEGYCKEVLWPLFHYIVSSKATDGRAELNNWADYVAVNRQFADTIIAHYQPGDIVCIHDYHLLLVPQMLRTQLPEATIGIFIHATFPSSEIFRCLTTRSEILEGMLGATLAGFQTYSYARHFISSCTRVLGCESNQVGVNHNGHIVSVGAFPIGIDADRVHRFCKEPGVAPKINAIRDMYAGKKIVIGRDKLDETKGVLQKLLAFEKFLHDYPEWRNNVVLIQVATPTHGEHAKLEAKISETVSHINGTYGSLQFTPVHYFHQDIDRDEYYALLSVADVGLITCVRDGMNTTSFEFTICQHETHAPLILSEFAGTANSLSAAMLINPWDYAEVAKAIHDALTMLPEEKSTRHEQLYQHVISHTAEFWAHSFVKQLVDCSQQQSLRSHSTPALDLDKLVHAYTNAKKRLLFFDYDGTLTPIVSVPSDAKPAADMLEALRVLCRDPRNEVWVISGRDQATLDEWLGNAVPNLGLSAEHGCYIKSPGEANWTSIVNDVDMSWKQDVTMIFDYYTERTQGSFVEHKKSSITWHYRMADAEYGAFQAKECQSHLENAIVSRLPVEILVGKKNLEVRPMSINKGEIVKRILTRNAACELVICAGDDKTDEDMFRMLNVCHSGSSSQPNSPTTARWMQRDSSLFSITVGPPEKKTMANWHVRTSFEVVGFLTRLAAQDKPQ